ncbi:hypothetical protein B0J11DRAFT_487829 [Dendryphion nanum]|uniref:Uncharacterized protein n=1 Tax=Dendryphion nanum TaxID=256645 RepID=A0A9P9DR74_9PLEO|nr:hypothetical protein B0J11DRAFT_487829 [Dendryphion nanum]
MALDTQAKVCLGVAIDHRIRRLFKPVVNDLTESSEHVSRIEARGSSLKRSRKEIQVTAQIAGPPVKGGIAITLLQPRDNHRFEEGLNSVIENCKTLNALDDIFFTASCGTLDIRTGITVVDLLPYVHEKIEEIDDTTLRESFRVSVQAICDKEPEILLCAGRVWLPRAGRFDDRKGDAWRMESIGIGKRFGSTPKLPTMARVRREKGGFAAINRVNGFHPSHAMNHNSHASLLRQLLILIAAETCGTLRGDWEEKEWMNELRESCQGLSNSLSDVSPPKSPLQNPHEKPGKYIPYYQELYSDALLDLQNCVSLLVSDPKLANKTPRALYESLVSSGLSEKCNNATLILRQMSRLQDTGWPDSVAWRNEKALEKAASETLGFVKDLLRVAKRSNSTQLAEIIQRGANSIRERVTPRSGKHLVYELDLSGAGDDFLDLATDIETLLSDLLPETETPANVAEQEEGLSDMMSRMNLMPQV